MEKLVHVTAIRSTERPLVSVTRPAALTDCQVAMTATKTSLLQLPLLPGDLLRECKEDFSPAGQGPDFHV